MIRYKLQYLTQPIYGFFLSVILLFTALYITEKEYTQEKVLKRTVYCIQQIVNQQVIGSKTLFEIFAQKKKLNWPLLKPYLSHLQSNIVVFKNDSLVYWDNNHFPIEKLMLLPSGKSKYVFTESSRVIALKTQKKNFTFIVFRLLKDKDLPVGVKLLPYKTGNHTKNDDLKKLGITIATTPPFYPLYITALLLLCYTLAFYFAAEFILQFFLKKTEPDNKLQQTKHSIYLIITFFILRIIQHWTGYPEPLNTSIWTTVKITNIFLLRNLSDLLLDAIVIIELFKWLRNSWRQKKESFRKLPNIQLLLNVVILLLLPLALFALSADIFQSDGIIPMNIQNSYLTVAVLWKLIILFLINLTLYIWMAEVTDLFKRRKVSYALVMVLLTFLSILIGVTIPVNHFHLIVAYTLTTSTISIIWYVPRKSKPFFHSIIILFIFSLTVAFLLNRNQRLSEEAHQQYAANMLTQKQDPYLEYLLGYKAQAITKDKKLTQLIEGNRPKKEEVISRYLNNQYFSGFLRSYTKQVTLCEPGQQLEIQPDNKIISCNTYFHMLAGKTVDSTRNFKLSRIKSNNESIYYLARFHFLNGKKPINLYIEFFTTRIPKGLGYPELLKNDARGSMHRQEYSFAYYQAGKLEYKFGDFLYPIDYSEFRNAPLKTFYNKGQYTHYILSLPGKEKLIVSRPKQTLSEWLLPFSIHYILSAILLIGYIVLRYGREIKKNFQYSFSTRLQISIFTAMVLVYGILTMMILYYFNNNSQQTLTNNLKEKTHSVLIELQQKLAPYATITAADKQEIQSYLQKLSMIFFTDINLYNNQGWLLASSRPEIFTRGLQSRLINPTAFFEIEKKHKLFYLGKEKIKNVTFYSSYAPFIQSNGNETGIINLPYFSKQPERQRNYELMLANLINLFLIIGLAGLLFMMYLSRLLTKPLQLLQQKMEVVDIEKQNEKITWNREDEIGKLITAYNKMVEKLEESARLLKDSAQEKAWREMAQQVAHEIRNPLTPMKLNIQYLMRLSHSKAPDFEQKFKHVSASLIDQIETMNEVVNLFSEFAKTKKKSNTTGDLWEALSSTTTLFKKSYPVKINLKTESQEIRVKSPAEPLVRIFNNMLKNAVQSMENKKEKVIDIDVKIEANYAIVKITDHGNGISEEHKAHIFQPYFTTKTSGTGLGLAIVKRLMNDLGGDILFESAEGKGTTFVLKFPLA